MEPKGARCILAEIWDIKLSKRIFRLRFGHIDLPFVV